MKPTLVEQQSQLYIESLDYIMKYKPRSITHKEPHAYDDYLKKLEALRKRGRTEKKFLPVVPRIEVKSLITEIGVKDSVIQKLNNRVYKLESIIQVICVILSNY